MASGPIPPNPSASSVPPVTGTMACGVLAIASWPKPRACSLNFLSLELEDQMRRHRERQAPAAEWIDDGAAA